MLQGKFTLAPLMIPHCAATKEKTGVRVFRICTDSCKYENRTETESTVGSLWLCSGTHSDSLVWMEQPVLSSPEFQQPPSHHHSDGKRWK